MDKEEIRTNSQVLGSAFLLVAMLLLLMTKIGESNKYANYLGTSAIFVWLTILMVILSIVTFIPTED